MTSGGPGQVQQFKTRCLRLTVHVCACSRCRAQLAHTLGHLSVTFASCKVFRRLCAAPRTSLTSLHFRTHVQVFPPAVRSPPASQEPSHFPESIMGQSQCCSHRINWLIVDGGCVASIQLASDKISTGQGMYAPGISSGMCQGASECGESREAQEY